MFMNQNWLYANEPRAQNPLTKIVSAYTSISLRVL